MKKVILLCVIIAIVVSLFLPYPEPNYTHGVYEITIVSERISNNHVGNEWDIDYYCGNLSIYSGKQWTVPLDTIEKVTIDVNITEDDKWPDISYASIPVTLSDNFKTSKIITVIEDNGSFKGNKALWEITCTVKLIEKTFG